MTKDNENRHLRPSSSRGSEFDSVKFGSLSSEKSADCCNSFSSRRERGFRTACENESVMSKERDALHRALENSSRNCVEEKTAATSGSTRVIRLPSKMPLFLFLIAEISQGVSKIQFHREHAASPRPRLRYSERRKYGAAVIGADFPSVVVTHQRSTASIPCAIATSPTTHSRKIPRVDTRFLHVY